MPRVKGKNKCARSGAKNVAAMRELEGKIAPNFSHGHVLCTCDITILCRGVGGDIYLSFLVVFSAHMSVLLPERTNE